ncbi:MAG: HAD-IA family hydrolase [Synergistaceae bacterium]|nr:HAD-IA family hydrolase [Synergistaceae bacterium]
MIKAILFDFDLTIANTFFAVKKGVKILSEHFNLRFPTDHEIYAIIGLPLTDCWKQLWGYYNEEWLEYFSATYRPYQADLFVLFDDTRDTLEYLVSRGLFLGVVTNRHFIKSCLTKLNIIEFFDVAIGAEEMTHPKPHPEPLLTALNKLKVDKSEALYVGDTDIDMRTALAAGVDSVGVAQGHFDKKMLFNAGAKYVVSCVSEIKELLKELK